MKSVPVVWLCGLGDERLQVLVSSLADYCVFVSFTREIAQFVRERFSNHGQGFWRKALFFMDDAPVFVLPMLTLMLD